MAGSYLGKLIKKALKNGRKLFCSNPGSAKLRCSSFEGRAFAFSRARFHGEVGTRDPEERRFFLSCIWRKANTIHSKGQTISLPTNFENSITFPGKADALIS